MIENPEIRSRVTSVRRIVQQGLEDLRELEGLLQPASPPPPPPPLPPPPSGDDPLVYPADWKALTGFWDGWRGRSREKFQTAPDGSYGIMRTNTQAARRLFSGPPSQGWFSCEVYFDTQELPIGGGKHLLTISSSVNEGGWLRPDLKPTLGKGWKFDTYNSNENRQPWYYRGGTVLDIVCDTWATGIPCRVGVWLPLEIRWRRLLANRFWLKLNSYEHEFTIHPASVNPYKVVVGNMDDLDSFGGNASVRFRNFQWGTS